MWFWLLAPLVVACRGDGPTAGGPGGGGPPSTQVGTPPEGGDERAAVRRPQRSKLKVRWLVGRGRRSAVRWVRGAARALLVQPGRGAEPVRAAVLRAAAAAPRLLPLRRRALHATAAAPGPWAGPSTGAEPVPAIDRGLRGGCRARRLHTVYLGDGQRCWPAPDGAAPTGLHQGVDITASLPGGRLVRGPERSGWAPVFSEGDDGSRAFASWSGQRTEPSATFGVETRPREGRCLPYAMSLTT
jgi:hypothetical protein